jgi:hypothetical protein
MNTYFHVVRIIVYLDSFLQAQEILLLSIFLCDLVLELFYVCFSVTCSVIVLLQLY